MKYYYREHILGYQKVKEEGKTAWAEIHGVDGFENFESRPFLEEILPQLHFSDPRPTVLEYGCGTGPGACFLSEKGFRVDGIDLIPLAIEIARVQAKTRSLDIHYEVQDICKLPHEGKKYDMIVDSYCLQGIVFAKDRERVFQNVQSRLKPKGYYLISTATFDESSFCRDKLKDTETGTIYNAYQEDKLIDMKTFIVYRRLDEKPDDWEDAVKVNGIWYLPVRRHWKPADLRAEIEATGFDVIYQDKVSGENLVCVIPTLPLSND
ncbi:MAG: class I SAM-dependent methyltransferase [Dehalococcoidales bacterium]|nr:MAG: class I SAM-dependent methyltransferase [Dehalococcoidales bacterium]